MNEDYRPPIASESTKPRLARPKAPRAHRLVAWGLVLTAGSKLLLAGMLALIAIGYANVGSEVWVGVTFFAVYGLLELRLMRAAWRGRVGRVTAVMVVLGLLLFAVAGISAALDPVTSEGIFNIFSAIAVAYLMSAIGILLHHRAASLAPAA